MSFSADKVNVLKGAFSQRRFSSSKDPSESGEYYQLLFSFVQGVRYVMLWELRLRISGTLELESFKLLEISTARCSTYQNEILKPWGLEISDSKVLSARATPSFGARLPLNPSRVSLLQS
jgi:hypothetical protein